MKFDAVQNAAREQFGRQSGRYGSGHILENVDDIREAIEGLSLAQPSRVLDVATGGGHTGLFFASLGHEVTLADIAEPMLERAAASARERGLRVTTRCHAAEDLPYPDGSFDLVACRVAAHHFSSPGKFVNEAARVLAPGGFLLVIDGSVEDDQPEAEEWLHAVEKLRDPSHHRFISPRTWKSMAETHGLTVIKCVLSPFKQPDLNWYFETAATSPANREEVLKRVIEAPESARQLFNLGQEDGKIVWWWQRLTLVARRY